MLVAEHLVVNGQMFSLTTGGLVPGYVLLIAIPEGTVLDVFIDCYNHFLTIKDNYNFIKRQI
jgi:hypothetical protein